MATQITIRQNFRGINELKQKLRNPKPYLKKVGEELVDYYKENMESEGQKLLKKQWTSLSPWTIAEKQRLGFGSKKILERTGKLRKGIKIVRLLNKKVIISNKVEYFAQHQQGDKSKKLPQREIIGINDEATTIAVNQIKKSLKI